MASGPVTEGPVTKVNIGRLTNVIFAFTLLLQFRNVRTPTFSDYLAEYSADYFGLMQLPDIASFVITFVIIAMIWVITFHIFNQISKVDRLYIYLHLAMMMLVIFIPITSYLNVMFPGKSVFPIIFHVNVLLIGVLMAVIWWHVLHKPSIMRPGIDRYHLECMSRKILYLPASAVAGMILAGLDYPHTQAIYLATMAAFVITTFFSHRRRWSDGGWRS